MTNTAPRLGANPVSTTGNVGPIPTGAAIYIDNETGQEVTEDWWPCDPLPKEPT